MILIDALYINNSGGKILLDYLIATLEKESIHLHYLLDSRIKNNHQTIKKENCVTYLNAGIISRHKFYLNNHLRFVKVFCFGNLPPTKRLNSIVYTYFHQKLFLEVPKAIPFKQKIILFTKSFFFRFLQDNTDFWIVQTETVSKQIEKILGNKQIKIIPFYPSLSKSLETKKEENIFVYVSSGATHKNHYVLIESFCKFFDVRKKGELHLTISEEFVDLYKHIENLKNKGYPIVNHGFVERNSLSELYNRAKFSIYPSLSESFGLGIVEAIEQRCLIIGADLPYTYAVCKPSLVFDPMKVESLVDCFNAAYSNEFENTKQIVFNEIEQIIELLK